MWGTPSHTVMIHRYTVGTLERGEREKRKALQHPSTHGGECETTFFGSRGASRAKGRGAITRVPTLPEGRPSGNVFLGQVERRCFGLGEGGLGGRVRVFHGSLGSRGADCVVVARGTVCFVVEPTFSQ